MDWIDSRKMKILNYYKNKKINHNNEYKEFERILYDNFLPRVKYLSRKNYIVTRNGIVVNDICLSIFNCYANPMVFFRALVIGFFSIFKRGFRKISEQVCIIHSIWSLGYYHWLIESMPRAMILQEKYPNAKIYLPSFDFKKYEEILNTVGIKSIEYFPHNKNILTRNLILTECPKTWGNIDSSLLRKMSNKIVDYFGLVNNRKDESERISILYITRKNARGRRVINEDELCEFILNCGGEVANFDNLNFESVVKLMRKSNIVVANHGAALANLIFMVEDTKIIELFPKRNQPFDYRPVGNSFLHISCYLNLCNIFNINHRYIICNHNRRRWQKTDLADLYVDIDILKSMIYE